MNVFSLSEAATRYDIEDAVERGLVRAVATPNGGETPQALVAGDDVKALAEMRQQPDVPLSFSFQDDRDPRPV
nr:hypothetical protein [Ardenticatena sp.]